MLFLTSQHYGRRICITDTLTVVERKGKDFNSSQPLRGCTVDEGRHNNGGYEVEEDFDTVVAMLCVKHNEEGGHTAAMREALATLHLMRERLEVSDYEGEEEPFMEDCDNAIAMLSDVLKKGTNQ